MYVVRHMVIGQLTQSKIYKYLESSDKIFFVNIVKRAEVCKRSFFALVGGNINSVLTQSFTLFIELTSETPVSHLSIL